MEEAAITTTYLSCAAASVANPTTIPGRRTPGAHNTAEATLAIQKRRAGIAAIPAASGTNARSGPKNLPMKTLLPP